MKKRGPVRLESFGLEIIRPEADRSFLGFKVHLITDTAAINEQREQQQARKRGF